MIRPRPLAGWTGLLLLLVLQAAAASVQGPQELVQETTDKVLARLKAEREQLQAEPALIYPLVEDLVLPHFDFARMSAWVLGKYWRRASPEQRARFTDEFRNLLVRTYATALLEYTDQRIDYLPFHAEPGAERVTVRTEILQSGGPPIPLYYSLYRREDGWKVYDISVEGVSLVTNYRSSFASEIRQGGLDKLIAKLGDMNREKGAGNE